MSGKDSDPAGGQGMAKGARQEELRAEIDRLDSEIQRLINRRAAQVLEIARLKEADGGPYYRPEREAQILRRVAERNDGPFPAEDMARLFREIMSSCLALERQLRVAYLGPEASFTHMAVHTHFGHAVEEAALQKAPVAGLVDGLPVGPLGVLEPFGWEHRVPHRGPEPFVVVPWGCVGHVCYMGWVSTMRGGLTDSSCTLARNTPWIMHIYI